MAAAADGVLLPMPRCCAGCDGREDAAVEAMLQWQKVSDILIAASVLSIPLVLLYFATRDALAPLRRALLQLGTFVVLCGVTHLLNVLSQDCPGSRRVLAALTAAKILSAVASSSAAASLPVFFPRVLRLKVREDFLRSKARQLDHDLAAIRRREETAWRVIRTLTQHVCHAVDACTIRRTTVLQLSAALDLHNCAVWMPTDRGACDGALHLVHQLLPDNDAEQVFDSSARVTISFTDPDVADVMASKDAKVLRPCSALAMASSGGQAPAGTVAAIRLPILGVANSDDQKTQSEMTSYAILVLVLPPNDHHGSPRSWSNQDLEIVQTVADQVAVSLSHAAALEESQLIRHKLAEQQAALLQAKHELASATKARNAAHSAMRDTMRRPMHPVVGLLSVMQQEAAATMRLEQRLVVHALASMSTLSSTLIDDVPLSSPRLVMRRPFELRSLIRNVASVAGCLSSCREISFSHQLEANSLPEWVVGDDRRVFHVLLHIVDALLSLCHLHVAGHVLSFSACICNDLFGDDQHGMLVPTRRSFGGGGGNHVFVKFQIGFRRAPESNPAESLPASRRRPPRSPGSVRVDKQIAMCKKIVQMMNGNMWSSSDPEAGLGETMTLVLRFQLQQSLNPHAPGSGTHRSGPSSSTIPQHNFNGLRVLLADSDAMSLEVTRKLLERLGCQVVAVSSAAVCLSLLGSAGELPSFQLVVLDLDAHGAGAAAAMNGFEVALRIRERSNSCWLLVLVALAGNGPEDEGVRDMCRRAGVNGVIRKPITLPALGTELQRVLRQNNVPADGWVAIRMHGSQPS